MNEELVFDFEKDFAGTLHCIPMCVRLKLDRCGVKLSLKQWNRLPMESRLPLLGAACESAQGILAYKIGLERLIEERTHSVPEYVAIEPAPEWNRIDEVPARLVRYANALQVAAPSLEKWRTLSELQRFALFKLTRPNHDNDNFIPALREFGLIADPSRQPENE